jgi:hypothetical protein
VFYFWAVLGPIKCPSLFLAPCTLHGERVISQDSPFKLRPA